MDSNSQFYITNLKNVYLILISNHSKNNYTNWYYTVKWMSKQQI